MYGGFEYDEKGEEVIHEERIYSEISDSPEWWNEIALHMVSFFQENYEEIYYLCSKPTRDIRKYIGSPIYELYENLHPHADKSYLHGDWERMYTQISNDQSIKLHMGNVGLRMWEFYTRSVDLQLFIVGDDNA